MIGVFLWAGILPAQNFVFSGIQINDSQLSDFIVKVKKLNVGSDSSDAVTSMLGNPALKTRQSGVEEWKYDFLLKNAQDMENIQKIENALKERKQRRQNMSLDEFSRESSDTDEKYEKLYRIKMQLEMKPPIQVSCKIKISNDGKLSNVRVEKYMQDTTDILYVKGDSSGSAPTDSSGGQMPSIIEAPSNPNPGQIYFNKTDKHFYGWDGTAWLKLDTKS
jgi:hypothetical protein